MASPPSNELREILEFIAGVHRRWVLHKAVRRALTGAAILLTVFGALVPIEHVQGLPAALRVTLLIVTGLVVLVALWFLSRAFLGPVPHRRRARQLENYAPELREQLITAVEVGQGDEADRRGYAGFLVRHTVEEARRLLREVHLGRFWSRAGATRGLRWFAAAAAATVVLALAFQGPARRTLYAVTHPTEELPRPVPFEWQIETEAARILQYESVTLEARADGPRPPRSARLHWRYGDDGDWFAEELSPVATDRSRFSHTLSSLPGSITYRFSADGQESETRHVEVARRPELVNVVVNCRPPSYTGIDEFALDATRQRWIVPEGSRLELVAHSDRPLARGHILLADSSQVALNIDGSLGTAEFHVRQRQTIRVVVVDDAGFDNYDPVPFEIEVIPDLPPQIALLKPGGDRDIPEAMRVHVAAALLDDYGFSRLEMISRVVGQEGEREEQTQTLVLPSDLGREGVYEFDWALMDMRLFPGDRVIYRARIYDTREPVARWAESETYVLRLPTLDEIIAETERQQAERTDQVAEAVRKQQKMAQDLREMARQLAGREKVEWEHRQELEQAYQTQQRLAEDLQKWAEDIEREAEQLAQNRMTSLEMLQKMNEISRLLQEVMTPELMEQLARLQQAMEALTPEEMRQALEDFQMSEEELLAQLDRTLAQLRQMQMEQMMENMLRMAERLTENQEAQNRAAEAAPDQPTLDSLAREEQALREQMNDLQEQARKLSELNQESNARAEIEMFAQTAMQNDADADMEEMTQQMQAGQQSQASQSGKKASSKMRQMLANMQQQMMNMQNQMNAEQLQALQQLTRRTLSLSEEQESMGDSTASLSRQSLALRDLARRQAAMVQGIEVLTEEFNEQAKQNLFLSPDVRRHLSEGRRQAEQAMRTLSERNGAASQSFQYETMFSLNEATRSLMESMQNQNQCQGSKSGQGQMHKGMQNLSQQQLELNQQTQSMRNPHGLTPSEQQTVERLSGQQQSIQRQMQDLASQFSDGRDRLGRLDEMARSMDEIIEDLQSGDIADGTLERQRNIYNRMLDYQKSLQRQDYENRRQSRQATELAGRAPDPLSPARTRSEDETARWERFQSEWYPPGFRALVKEYFESVTQRESESR